MKRAFVQAIHLDEDDLLPMRENFMEQQRDGAASDSLALQARQYAKTVDGRFAVLVTCGAYGDGFPV